MARSRAVADEVAPVEALGAVQAGGVVENGFVRHADLSGGTLHDRCEVGERAAHSPSNGIGGVVGRHNQKGTQRFVQRPGRAHLHADPVRIDAF